MNTFDKITTIPEFSPQDENLLKFMNSIFSIIINICLKNVYEAELNKKNIFDRDGNLKIKKETIRIMYVNLPDYVKKLIPWLDDSTMFVFTYRLDENAREYGVNQYLGKGIWLRQIDDKGCPFKICNAAIYVNLNINIYNIDYNVLLKKVSEIRSIFTHELAHIYRDYKELITNENHKRKEASEIFNSAYINIIKGTKSEDDDERHLCDLVYMTNDCESFAYKSEFYQSLLNHIEFDNKRLDEIKIYWPYNKYNRLNNTIDSSINNQSVFDDNKKYIIDIFGSSFGTLKSFKKNIKFVLNDILDKLNDIYLCAKNVEDSFFNGKLKKFDLSDYEELYKDYKNNILESNLQSIREEHKPVYKTYFENYVITPVDRQIKMLKELLKFFK